MMAKHEIKLHQEINGTLFTVTEESRIEGRRLFPLIHNRFTCGEVN